jgi:hypothetical protein
MTLIIVVGFVAVGLLIGSFATASAPVGYEDETGFHYGQQPGGTLANRETALPDVAGLTPKHA